jgi:uncharacterized membrane protein (DUF2068 family)
MSGATDEPHGGLPPSIDAGIRAVAVYEGLKGIVVLAVASGLTLVHKDLHDMAMRLVEHAHLDPAAKYPRIFLTAAEHLQDTRLVILASAAVGYVAIHLAEAYGLWHRRTWAEVLAASSAGIYLPFEVYELVRRATAVRATLLVANVAVVVLMLLALRRRDRHGNARYHHAS